MNPEHVVTPRVLNKSDSNSNEVQELGKASKWNSTGAD